MLKGHEDTDLACKGAVLGIAEGSNANREEEATGVGCSGGMGSVCVQITPLSALLGLVD